MFVLHPQLAADSLSLGKLPLCEARLMDNRLFPWIVLVPQREGLVELTDLEAKERGQLMEEIAQVSQVMQALLQPDKMNVAALGNIVPQLHVHVIARFRNDAAWPDPVWGRGSAAYRVEEATMIRQELRQALGL